MYLTAEELPGLHPAVRATEVEAGLAGLVAEWLAESGAVEVQKSAGFAAL